MARRVTIVRFPPKKQKKAKLDKPVKREVPKTARKKGYDKSLPPPAYMDGHNRYHGKTVENSQILCMLCKVYGCICVKPSRTPLELQDALQRRIQRAETSIKLGLDPNAVEQMLAWGRRLAKVMDGISRGLHLVQAV